MLGVVLLRNGVVLLRNEVFLSRNEVIILRNEVVLLRKITKIIQNVISESKKVQTHKLGDVYQFCSMLSPKKLSKKIPKGKKKFLKKKLTI